MSMARTASKRKLNCLIDRFPVVIFAGGALLGYVAGEMLVSEAVFKSLLETHHYLHYVVPAACAVLVLALGHWLASKKSTEEIVVDLLDAKVDSKHSEK